MSDFYEVYESNGEINVRNMPCSKKLFLVELDDFSNEIDDLWLGRQSEGLTSRLDMALPRIRTDTACSAGDPQAKTDQL